MNPGVFWGALDHWLEGCEWIVDDYSIADIATFGCVNAVVLPSRKDIRPLSSYSNVQHGSESRGWRDLAASGFATCEACMTIIAAYIITTKASPVKPGSTLR